MKRVPARGPRAWALRALWAIAGLLAACAGGPPGAPADPPADPRAEPTERLVIVAFASHAEPLPAAGGLPRGYGFGAAYTDSAADGARAGEIGRRHGLAAQAAWTIQALDLHCVLYAIASGSDRAAVLERLARDPEVALAQPLNTFETLSDGAAAPRYNDPYFALQRGFSAIGAAEAQRFGEGRGVKVAVIDTGVDARHPDFGGRVDAQRDFAAAQPAAGERHGTEVAGVIGAGANNRLGIVGIAPQVRLLSYRACWAVSGGGVGAARCDSFSLAQALAAAIAAGADVVNLSLGGPRDPLLERLTAHALRRGTLVVAAVPASGRVEGFPAGVPGVIAVAATDAPAEGALNAPGRDVLTLAPGGSYDFASGSSLATAHVSGALALLRGLDPKLDTATAQALLARRGGQAIDLCDAVRRLRAAAACDAGR